MPDHSHLESIFGIQEINYFEKKVLRMPRCSFQAVIRPRIAVIAVFAVLFSLSVNHIVPANSQEELIKDVLFELNFSPPVVELGIKTYQIGYINLVGLDGKPVLFTEDITVRLVSKNPSLVSVPSTVTIPKNQDYAKFAVSVGNQEGQTDITAIYGNFNKTKSFRVGGISVEVPLFTQLKIDVPVTTMNVGTQMPLSVFLDNNGTIVQAPKDIKVSFSYEESVVRLENQLTIKKGDYYATTILRALDRTGEAFITATTQEPPLNTVKQITISSSLPTKLQITVLPNRLIAKTDRTIDLFVRLLDQNNNPVVANRDIPIELFSNLPTLDQKLDKDFQYQTPVIKNGQWGFYHRIENILFQDVSKQNFIGALSPGYGQTLGPFEVVEILDNNNKMAQNKTVAVMTVTPMPPDSLAPITYQVIANKGTDEDIEAIENLITNNILRPHPFYPSAVPEDVDEDSFYFRTWPLTFQYEKFSESNARGRVASSNTELAEIIDGGKLSSESSYVTGFIKSGSLKEGQVTISVALKGLATGQNTTSVQNVLAPRETVIYSPAGQDRIVFNNEGISDLYLVTLDAQKRPTNNKERIQYLLEPINQLHQINVGPGFTKTQLQSSSFVSEILTGKADITVSPVGANVDTGLKKSATLSIAPSSSYVQVFLPVKSAVAGQKIHQFGTIQLVDFFGNPVPVLSDLRVELRSDNPDLVTVPTSVIIPTGKSFVEFPITVGKGEGSAAISATTKGFSGTMSTLNIVPFIKELIISPPTETVQYLVPSELVFYVDDNYNDAVSDATVRIKAENATIFPTTLTTNEFGEGRFMFTPNTGPTISLTITASKSGYTDDTVTIDLDVPGYVELQRTTPFGVPTWVLYVAIAGALGGVGFVVMMIMRKPKPKLEEEEEEL